MTKTNYKIIAFGCAMNISDAERIKTLMNKNGFLEVDKNPEVVILVACSVRQSAIDRIWGAIEKIKSQKLKVKTVLTGCVLPDDRKKLERKVDILLDIKNIQKLPSLINKNIRSEINDNYFHINPEYNSKFSALVPIMTGCDNFCAYCAVPYTRGREYSRPVDEVLKEAKKLIKQGYTEIILLGQNVNSYCSQDTRYKIQDTNKLQDSNIKFQNKIIEFPDLLRLINNIPGDFWIRFFTSHPKDLSDKLIKAMAECNKVCKYLNLPVQSGDNIILKKMNRKYTIEDYKKLVEKLRGAMPKITLSTDVIVGFPGETKKQFENTTKLFKEIEYDMAYISEYSARPNTQAAKMKDNVTTEEKKRREKILLTILKETAYKNNKKYLNKKVDVLVEKKLENNNYLGKTDGYKYVKFQANKNLIGKVIRVKINDITAFRMTGELI